MQAQGCSGILLYFGDLDPRGLWIPVKAGQQNRIEVRPDKTLYQLLFETAQKKFTVHRESLVYDSRLLEWLPENLREFAADCFKRGRRLPQELISIWDLTDLENGGAES
ncbi:MAG: hypothetical protein DMG65_13245 [Candidatus Angelobacter sp. Gp1-AA117]|nr:MAG: hypothetical protein DMG65_13245 [Candidatus Angelobacter sp. Gp1-AA117]